MIDRDPQTAASMHYDIAIVGGGIYGAMLALMASRQGHRTLLVERDDFGGATSWNSLRIVHGGLRYLQSLDLPRFRESVAERRWFLQHFPDQVHPLPCLMPLYGKGARRPLIMRIALQLNAALSWRRNAGVTPECHLPAGRVLSPSATIERFPLVDRDGLRGAAMWYDAVMPDSQRLLIEILHWATAHDATCLNYTRADRLLTAGGRVQGLAVVDETTGSELEFHSTAVVNCAGPWCEALSQSWDPATPQIMRPSLAFNVHFDTPAPCAGALAVAPRKPAAQTYFMHPWKGGFLAGTVHAPWSSATDDITVDPRHLDAFIRDLNMAIPGLALSQDAIRRVHAGLLPAETAGTAQIAKRPRIIDHGRCGGVTGLISVSGVKFTTARDIAIRTLRLLPPATQHLHHPRPTPAEIPVAEEVDATNPALRDQIANICQTEAVVHLDDLVFRRSDWSSRPNFAMQCAEIAAQALSWPPDRSCAEVERLQKAFAAGQPRSANHAD
jgi:glycerol-3-phosphate dehydrogenase